VVRVADSQLIFPEEEVEVFSGFGVENVILDASYGQIFGKITKQTDGNAIANAEIILEQSPGAYGLPMTPIRRTEKTDSKGVYSFENLGQGLFQIQVKAPGYGTICENLLISRDKMKIKQDMTLATEGKISGMISGITTNENITLQVFDEQKKVLILQDIHIEKDNSFTINGLSGGDYALILSSENKNCIRKKINVRPGQNKSANIQYIEGTSMLSGIIKTGGKQTPVDNVMIIAESNNFSGYAFTQPDGSYSIGNLPKGAYTILVIANNFDSVTKINVRLKENEAKTGIDFLLKPVL
jgi:flagellar hook assembly protein FlgD